ncbi:MAG: type II secretion system protein [Verrucomicrobia bacterium]|nr:type II secretion system protein [Verrucomicrobiota bacterium]
MKVRKKKRPLTLLEIMIVIVLIGLIGSVIGFNMKGSLDEGRAFKTRQAKDQIQDILMLEVARGTPFDEVIQNREKYLENSGLVKKPREFLKDGWGEEFDVRADGRSGGSIIVKSAKLAAYERKKSEKLGKPVADAEEDDN